MASSLPVPTDFIASYNGFVFPPDHTVTTAVRVRPVEDRALRTVKYNEIYLRLKTTITGSPTDAAVVLARYRLTKNGGVLVYSGRGFGPLDINTGKVRDVLFGPKVRELSFKPLGYKYACELEWECTVHVPECPDARYKLGFLDLSYRMEYHIRSDGRTDRVVTGTLLIPNNRVVPGSTDVFDSPDRYRELLTPKVPVNFRRDWQPWRIDESRTSLGFGWTDREFGPNVLPPGIVKDDTSHSVRQDKGGGYVVSAIATIRSRMTVAAGYRSEAAQRAFWLFVEQRVALKARAMAAGRDPTQPVTYLPIHFEATEPEVRGGELVCEFVYVYRIINSKLADLISHSGLWEDTGDEWAKWQVSTQASALNPRGSTGLIFRPQDDQIVDLCGNYPTGLKPIGGTRQPNTLNLNTIPFPPPDPNTSWLLYNCTVFVESDGGGVEGRVLAQRAWQKPGAGADVEMRARELRGVAQNINVGPRKVGGFWDQITGVANAAAAGRGGGADPGVRPGAGKGNPPPDGAVQNKDDPKVGDIAIQRRAAPMVVVFLIGEALRVGFPIQPPTLGLVNGVVPVPMNRLEMGEGFASAVVSTTANGYPVYGAKWRLRFVLPQVPDGPIPVPNPIGIPQPKG